MRASIISISSMLFIRLFAICISFLNIFLIKHNFLQGSVLIYQTSLSIIVFLSVFSLFGAENYIVNRFQSNEKLILFSSLSSTLSLSMLVCLITTFCVIQYLYESFFLSLMVSLLSAGVLLVVVDASIARAKKRFLIFQCLRSLLVQVSLALGVIFSLLWLDELRLEVVFCATCVLVFLLLLFNKAVNVESIFNLVNVFNRKWELRNLFKSERMSYFVIATYASFMMLFDLLLCSMLFPDNDDYVIASRFAQVLMVLFVVINNYYSSVFRKLYLEGHYHVLKKKFIESVVLSIVSGSTLFCVLWFFSLYLAKEYFDVGNSFFNIFILLLIAYLINLLLSVPITFLLMVDKVKGALFVTVVSAIVLFLYFIFCDFDVASDVAVLVVVAFGVYKTLALIIAVYELSKMKVGDECFS